MSERTRRIVRGISSVMLAGAVVAVLAAAWSWFTTSDLARTADITIAGTDRTDPARVLRASDLHISDPILHADLDGAAVAVYQLPTVADVAVHRTALLTLTIDVVEHQPAFALTSPDASQPVLVTDYGVALDPVSPDEVATLPTIRTNGPLPEPGDRVAGATADVLDVAARLPDDLRTKVATVAAPNGSVTMKLRSGASVQVGTAVDLGSKVAALQDVITELGPLPGGVSVNLLAPSAPAVSGLPQQPAT